MMAFSKELIDYVSDGDLHATMEGVKHSTDLRAIVTVGYMIEHEKAVTATTATASTQKVV